MLWGANLAETYPPYVRWLDKARDKGVQIVCVDCRKTPTGNWASTIVMPRPGTDGALALGTVRHLFETGTYDADYVAENTRNVDVLRTNSEPWTVEAVAEGDGPFSGYDPQLLRQDRRKSPHHDLAWRKPLPLLERNGHNPFHCEQCR